MTLKPWIVGLVLVVAAGTASAQTGVGARRGGNLFQPAPKSADPDATLFTNAQAELKVRQAVAAQTNAQRNPTCYTMRIVPVDPAIDPGIRIEKPSDGTRYAARQVPLPPACK